jgi:hypothetical protein
MSIKQKSYTIKYWDCGKCPKKHKSRKTAQNCLDKRYVAKGPQFDLTNQVFGRLTVIERMPPTKRSGAAIMWLCKCECGNIKAVRSGNLRNDVTKSCGCIKRGPKIRYPDNPYTAQNENVERMKKWRELSA